jgi:DNA-binding NarL/FixJ family response regulator
MGELEATTWRPEPRRVLVADANPDVRAALCLLLTREPLLCVVGQVGTLSDLLADARRTGPGLLLLDWDLPGLHDGDGILRLRASCHGAAFIALSTRPECAQEVLTSGFEQFVSKSDPPARLLAALRAVLHSPA